jgi:hypothetical protein
VSVTVTEGLLQTGPPTPQASRPAGKVLIQHPSTTPGTRPEAQTLTTERQPATPCRAPRPRVHDTQGAGNLTSVLQLGLRFALQQAFCDTLEAQLCFMSKSTCMHTVTAVPSTLLCLSLG